MKWYRSQAIIHVKTHFQIPNVPSYTTVMTYFEWNQGKSA